MITRFNINVLSIIKYESCIKRAFANFYLFFQYTDMMRERPLTRTFEDLASDIRAVSAAVSPSSSETGAAQSATDLPPKYEDLEQPPPYDARCQRYKHS